MRFFLWFSILSLSSQFIYSQNLTRDINTVINQKLPHASIGALVKDAETGEIIYSRNPDKLMYPASNMKLFTAAAALYKLTANHRFLTTLSKKDKNFYFTFSGSPSLTTDNLTQLLTHLKNQGTKTIEGDIIMDTSRFKPPYYTGGVSYDDLGWFYSAPDTAVILNENAIAYDFISAKKLGMPVQIKAKTRTNELTIQNEVITVSKQYEKEHCNLNIEIKAHNTLRLFGCMAQDSKPKTMTLAVPNPVLLARQIITKALDQNGIILKGQIINGHTPPDAQIIARLQSKSLIQLIAHMLNESDNLYANSLTKQLAYSVTGDGTYKQGVFAIKKILTQHTHLDMTQIELADGLGTRYNLVTPEQIVVLLTDLYHDKNVRAAFLKGLPQAGVSGTLKERMKKTTLKNLVFAKTGTMHDISSLSGYIMNLKGRNLIFSIVINGINQPINIAKSLEEDILLIIEENIMPASKEPMTA